MTSRAGGDGHIRARGRPRDLHAFCHEAIDGNGDAATATAARGGTRPLALSVAAAIAMCGILPFVVATSSTAVGSTVPVGLLVVIMLSGCRLARLIYLGDQRIAEAMVWLFAYIFLGLAPLVQLRSGIDPNTTPAVDHSQDAVATVLVLVGLVAFVIGVAWQRRSRALPTRPARGLNERRLILLAIFGLAVAVYVVGSIGVPVFFSSRADFDTAFAVQWTDPTMRAMIRALSTLPLLVSLVGLLLVYRGRMKLAAAILPACVLLALGVQVNPVTSPRYVFGTTLLGLLAAVGLVATRSRFRTTVLAAVAGVVFVFPFADVFRYSSDGRFKASSVAQALTTGDFDAFAQINNAVLYVSTYGTTVGRQALGVVLFWVPRSIWQEKPVDTGVLLADFRNYGFTNLSAPLWSELYVNGGWLALIVGMLLFGWLIRRWDDRSVAVLRVSRTPGLLGCILPFYLLIVLRGSLLQATVGLTVIVACYAAIRSADHDPEPSTPGSDRTSHTPLGSIS